MRKNVTYISSSKLLDVVAQAGLKANDQAGFIKVPAAKGRQVYIAKTKQVGRVDISGFLFAGEGVKDLGAISFGAVKQQLDFTRTEEEILKTFAEVLEHMKTLAPAEKVVKQAPMARTKNSKAPERKVAPKEELLGRLALIKKVAAQHGTNVSTETLALADEGDSSPE